jgi:hypothetical protein
MSHPLVALMRRYVIDYLQCHNPSVCAEIMEPDYVLHMADVDLTPRDDVYVPAVESQLRLFPGLGMTVNDLVVSGNRLAMRFSQHGASTAHNMRRASWAGIGLYRWNGSRLTETYAIEDYESRRIQLASGGFQPVDAPMIAPWDVEELAPDLDIEQVVRTRITSGGLFRERGIRFDDEPCGIASPIVDADSIEIDDLFGAGRTVAFKIAIHGRYRAGLDVKDEYVGQPLTLHATGMVEVGESGHVFGRVIRGRGPARRSLLQQVPRA